MLRAAVSRLRDMLQSFLMLEDGNGKPYVKNALARAEKVMKSL